MIAQDINHRESGAFSGKTFALPALDKLVLFSDFLRITKCCQGLVLQDFW